MDIFWNYTLIHLRGLNIVHKEQECKVLLRNMKYLEVMNPKIKNKCELPWVEKSYRRVKIEININPACKESRVR